MFITILYSAVSRILKTRNLLQILTKSSRLLWLPIFITRTARRPAVLILLWREGGKLQREGCDDNDCFLYMLLQLFAMHKPRLQAPSDYISDVFDSLDPSPQHRSCSFRFKWLELIVPWGSSVIYWPGILLLLLFVVTMPTDIAFILGCAVFMKLSWINQVSQALMVDAWTRLIYQWFTSTEGI